MLAKKKPGIAVAVLSLFSLFNGEAQATGGAPWYCGNARVQNMDFDKYMQRMQATQASAVNAHEKDHIKVTITVDHSKEPTTHSKETPNNIMLNITDEVNSNQFKKTGFPNVPAPF